MNSDDVMEALRKRLTAKPHEEGYGEVTFTRTDGMTVVIDDVFIDSIGTGATGSGVVSCETIDDELIHLPFIRSWTVEYRF